MWELKGRESEGNGSESGRERKWEKNGERMYDIGSQGMTRIRDAFIAGTWDQSF